MYIYICIYLSIYIYIYIYIYLTAGATREIRQTWPSASSNRTSDMGRSSVT